MAKMFWSLNELLDSDIPINALPEEEIGCRSYSISYFEFGYGYDKTESRATRLAELQERLREIKAREKAEAERNTEEEKMAIQASRQEKIDKAIATGQPVVLSCWQEDCNDPHEECDIDDITEYAMPDGSIKTVRSHNW